MMTDADDGDAWQPVSTPERHGTEYLIDPEDVEHPDWLTEGAWHEQVLTQLQRRMSRTAESPSPVYAYLTEHGPTPSDELPSQPTTKDKRERGVRRIKHTALASAYGVGDSGSSGRRSIVYLEEHDPERVVRAVLDANPEMLNTTKQGVTMRFGDHSAALKAAWREISDEFDDRLKQREYAGSDTYPSCPVCGESVPSVDLPHHIAGEHGEDS